MACGVPGAERAEPARSEVEAKPQSDVCGRRPMKAVSAGRRIAALRVVFKSKGRVKHVGLGQEIREATTGRVVAVLPKVWATAQARKTVKPQLARQPRDADKRAQKRPELAFYRKYTEALLRRYVQMSMEAGRVPSLMGKEMFRGRVTSYRVRTFEDVVIFRLDVENCLRRLHSEERQLIRRIALQEYTQGEAAMLLGMSLRTCVQRYGEAVDRLTAIFLESRMLEPLAECQECSR